MFPKGQKKRERKRKEEEVEEDAEEEEKEEGQGRGKGKGKRRRRRKERGEENPKSISHAANDLQPRLILANTVSKHPRNEI